MKLDEALALLESPDVAVRLDAAAKLRDSGEISAAVIPNLVAHLRDEGTQREEHTDWDGTVVDVTTHRVAERVTAALARLGTPAFAATVEAVEEGAPAWTLHQLVVALPMDAIVAAGEDVVGRACRFTVDPTLDGFPDIARREWMLGRASNVLHWARTELSRTEDRLDVLARRLFYSVGPSDELAAKELAAAPPSTVQRAARILAEALLHDPLPTITAQCAIAEALDKLGPVVERPLAARLVERAVTHDMFFCWPTLLPTIAAYADLASVIAPWLLAWIRDDKPAISIGDEHHAQVRRAAAEAIARLDEAAAPLHDALAEIYAAGPSSRRELVLRALPDRRVLVARLSARWRTILAGHDYGAINDALDAIHDLGAAATPLAQAVVPFISGPRSRSWKAALAAGSMPEAADVVVPALVRALDDDGMAGWACISLGRLGPKFARSAIPALEKRAAEERERRPMNPRFGPVLELLRGGGD